MAINWLIPGLFRAYSGLIPGLFRAYSGQFRQHGENTPMTRVFISYSHADDDLRNELESPSRHFATELQISNIVLLLVSVDFLSSEYCPRSKCNRRWNAMNVVTRK